MPRPSRAAQDAKTFATARARFLAHLGEDADPEQVVMADHAARWFVVVVRLEAVAETRVLSAEEMDTLIHATRMLHAMTRRLGIEPAPRRKR